MRSYIESKSRGRALIAGASLLVLLAGCARPTKPADHLTFEPEVTPQPTRVGSATIAFKLKDTSGKPVTGARAKLEANMSHAGMSPVFVDAREVTPGEYRCPIEFSMAGDWVITIRITLSDGQSFERQFEVRGVRSD